MHREGELLQVVGAFGAARCLAGGLHCGQEQGHKHPDDRDDDKQFDKRKSDRP
jgi:hypothetical protein